MAGCHSNRDTESALCTFDADTPPQSIQICGMAVSTAASKKESQRRQKEAKLDVARRRDAKILAQDEFEKVREYCAANECGAKACFNHFSAEGTPFTHLKVLDSIHQL